MDKNKKLFPQRLWELIHDEKYNFCLRWSPDGQRVYLNRNDFENHYLKTPNNQFHTQKAISFVRQMNMYGFRKVDDCYYENDNFKRNCHHLLKNMVRRHSNKAFYSTTNTESQSNNSLSNQTNNITHQQQHGQSTMISQHHHQRNQNYQQQQQHHQQASNNGPVARASVIDIERQTSAFNTAAAAVAAQRFRDAGGSVGNIGAALAAINSSNIATTLSTPTRSPLASTLYHRLAALNFDQSNQANEQFLQHRQQHHNACNDPTTLVAPNAVNIAQEKIGNSIQDHVDNHNITRVLSQRVTLSNQQQQQFDLLDIQQINTQQQQSALAARQASQQNLVRSLSQLKQPQVPLAIQQNLLASLQQHNPNLLLESLATLSSANHLAQMNQSPSSGGSMSPLELVVNPVPSSTSDHHSSFTYQPNIAAINDNVNSLMNLTKRSTNNMTIRSGVTGFNESSPFYHEQNDGENEIDQDDEDCAIDFEDGLLTIRNNGLLGNISTSSSNNNDTSRHFAQDSEDLSNAVLDLAKPSNTRSNGRYKSSKTSDQ